MFVFEFSRLGAALTGRIACCDWVDVCIIAEIISVDAKTAQLGSHRREYEVSRLFEVCCFCLESFESAVFRAVGCLPSA